MTFIKLCLVLTAAAVFAIACNQAAKAPNAANAPSNAAANVNKTADVTPGQSATPASEQADVKKLYETNCANCHKDTGKGGKVTIDGKELEPEDLTTAKMKAKSDDKLTGYIVDGAVDDGMPAFKDKLKPDQIKSLVKYIRALQGS